MENKDFTRRQFIQAGVTSGFALAVSPTTAWAITTSKEGIFAEEVLVPVGSDKMPAYWAMPQGKGPFPVVLVIQEIFGVHEYIQDVVRRLAHEGYLAIAPALYFRQGDVSKIESVEKIISEVVSKVPQRQVWNDLDATLKWLATSSKANVKRAAITGFCWGGNATWTYSFHNPSLKAGVAWYGRLVGNPPVPDTVYPLDVAKQIKVPVLGLYGGKDKGIPVESIKKMKAEQECGTNKSMIVVFPEAEHGFHADYRPSYHAAAAKEGWKKMLTWFKEHGV